MKKLIFLFLVTSFLPISKTLAIDASISHAVYRSTDFNYIEFHFYIVGSTLKYTQIDSINSQATCEIVIKFLQKGEIVKFDKFNLKSPPSLDPVNFTDMHRYELANGDYDIEVELTDALKPDSKMQYRSKAFIDITDRNLRMSDILLLSDVKADTTEAAKNGLKMMVLPYEFYDSFYDKLIFYTEIYNADKVIGEDFKISYYIERTSSTSAGDEKPTITGHKTKKAISFLPNVQQIDISKLPTGNYRLRVDLRNQHDDLLGEKMIYFQRANTMMTAENLDTLSKVALENEFVAELEPKDLRYALRAILMQVPNDEVSILNTVIDGKDTSAQRMYLFKHFAKINANLPELAYQEYMHYAKIVDKMYYNGYGYGFESDRGRIYMRYGRPDDIETVENETNAPPYEVWFYNKIDKTQQTNVKFLFYNPTLVARGFRLLHSNCRGELQNPRWKSELYRSVPNEQVGNPIDSREVRDNFTRRAERIFEGQ